MSAKNTPTPTLTPHQPLIPEFRGHRHLLFLAVLMALFPDSALPYPDRHTGTATTLVLLYAVISDQMLRLSSAPFQGQTPSPLACGDAALIGFALGLVNFNLASYLMLFGTLQFSALLRSGWCHCCSSSLAFASGTLTTLLVTELWPEHSMAFNPISLSAINLNPTISLLPLITVVYYFCATALQLFCHLRELSDRHIQLEREQQQHKLRSYKLSRYLSPPVWEAITQDREQTLQTASKRVTVFFSDIKDFNLLTEEVEADVLTGLLNNYLTEMSQIVSQFGGTVDKFMGDAIMVTFGDNKSHGVKADCLRCLAMSIAMRKRIAALQTRWRDQGLKRPLQVRMGINTGHCTVGIFGASYHRDYTVLGTEVNLASRLESAAEPGEILISRNSWSLVKDDVICRDKGTITVKGSRQPVKVYQVVDFRWGHKIIA